MTFCRSSFCPRHAHLTILKSRLHFQPQGFDRFGDLLGLVSVETLLDTKFLPGVAERRNFRILCSTFRKSMPRLASL